MKKKLVAIGGGENGRPLNNGLFSLYETESIDKEIIKLTKKRNPNFLFIAHSQNSSVETQESYYQVMKKIYGERFGCNCKDLKSIELDDITAVKEKINWADIIYEGGGDTLQMINLWKTKGFDKVLYTAWNKGKVICGISAGAVCWFKSCNSESLDKLFPFISINCLGWFDLHLTPHCDESGRYESTKQQLKQNGLIGVMLSNCAALEIVDNQYRIITSNSKKITSPKAYGLKAYWYKDKYYEEKISISEQFKDLTNLFKKDLHHCFSDER